MSNLMTPWFRNVFTDVFAGLMNFQQHEQCASFELRVVDCLEAYGVYHGKRKCGPVLDDLRECVMKSKQSARIEIMKHERDRQVKDGERAPEDKYAPPPAQI